VESGHSDMTWEVTRWIAHDKAADGFMHGQFDPWGMHVNVNYLGLNYPTDSFTGQDSYPVIAHKYSPVFPLSRVATYQAQNWDPGTDWEKDQFGNFPKDPIEIPGERALFAILDEADAAAFRFPVAALPNDTNHYVEPSLRSMAAALPSMVSSSGNKITQHVDYARQKAGAYPLTMIIYAMVPTSGISKAKAAAIAEFLNFVAGPGQVPGTGPGQLAPGYLPLPANLRAQTRQAATAVLRQAGRRSSSPTPSPTSSPGISSPSPAASPGVSASPAPSAGPRIVIVALKGVHTVGLTGYALPAVLIVGAAAVLAGASSLLASTGGAAIVTQLRRIRRLRIRPRAAGAHPRGTGNEDRHTQMHR
jgi:hypothetical protein